MAEVATTVVSLIAAPRKPFYAWLVPGVFYNQLETVLRDAAFLPGVAKTTGTTGPWDKAGSTRIVHLTDGTTVRETVTSATAPDYFAYRLTEFSSPMIRMLVKEARGQWWFTDSGSGLQAKWTYTAVSRNVLGALILLPVIKILWNRYMKAAMKVTKERAETEVARGAR
jgi:Polyketide cyclase / dehydrase and lipid transport